MKTTGAFLLVAGWLLVLCAIIMLAAGGARNSFVLAGLGVEILGLALAVRAHLPGAGAARARDERPVRTVR